MANRFSSRGRNAMRKMVVSDRSSRAICRRWNDHRRNRRRTACGALVVEDERSFGQYVLVINSQGGRDHCRQYEDFEAEPACKAPRWGAAWFDDGYVGGSHPARTDRAKSAPIRLQVVAERLRPPINICSPLETPF